MTPRLLLAFALLALPTQNSAPNAAFKDALDSASRALDAGDHTKAREHIERALERDPKSIAAWHLRGRWAEKIGDRDERIYALHQALRLSVAQKQPPSKVSELKNQLFELDPIAKDVLGMSAVFADKLAATADRYEKDGRPHAAIAVHKTILGLDPENVASAAAIERIAATPDPSLAGDAKPKDLFADVSEEWIREHDAQHSTWDNRAKLERGNYTTYTDAGYEVLVRAGEAMEQMNAFYRQFFRYGTEEDKRGVTRIELRIFKNRDEYLKLGQSPAEWSGGQFTGDAVETYVGTGGFDGMTQTLFHEAAHQFVSLATNAVGWLNEGLASFFEGTRILPNGTVLMNMPANHRLFPLVDRMDRGWMTDAKEGFAADGTGEPETAPPFRMVLENRYTWGPAWYAPTWGVVYFLYNYQDPGDGRFIYRRAFQEFINKSGGRVGEGAVENFEEVVLHRPLPPIKGTANIASAVGVPLPKTCADLDAVWKSWLTELRNEQQGKLEVTRPYKIWARCAVIGGDFAAAQEHFEKGLVATSSDPELLLEFAQLLNDKFKNSDRAAKLALEALRVLEEAPKPDSKAVRAAEARLVKFDPKRATLLDLQEAMVATARGIVQRYQSAGLPMMVMDVAWRLGTTLEAPELFRFYADALAESGKSLAIWSLAYNEKNLEGWRTAGNEGTFTADTRTLVARFGKFDEKSFDYQVLTLDKTTGGDFSMEALVQADKGRVNFCGFVFGQKDASSFHGLLLFPGKTVAKGLAESGYVDLMSAFGSVHKTWRHVPVNLRIEEGQTTAGKWRRLRLDVSGRLVDIWFDGVLLATHEFPSLDVLRGSFGLICGRGEARFRDVRYLARSARDPAGAAERAQRIRRFESSPEGERNSSYLGRPAPWPRVLSWAQNPRSSWEERPYSPQLLVLWSIQQNDLVPIDAWLRDFAQRYRDAGLEIVSITSPNDAPVIADYLQLHPFPGSVGVDFRGKGEVGIGESNELFFTRTFNLPRMLLIDLDQTVTWEGDPGFVSGEPWKPGSESFLDVPLAELIERRKLKPLAAWRAKWKDVALPALSRAELEPALPILIEANAFDRRYSPEAGAAQSRLGALVSAAVAIDATAHTMHREEADPAVEVLLAWGAMAVKDTPLRSRKDLKFYVEGELAKDWTNALRFATRYANKKKADEAAAAAELMAGLEALKGRFPYELRVELEAARAKGDVELFAKLCAEAEARPRRWLAHEYLGW